MDNHSKFYIKELDGVRFLAFALVFIHHNQLFDNSVYRFIAERGWIGVDLFFVLSSYLLTRILFIEYKQTGKLNIKNYYLRRILRIWPIYFLYVFIISDLPDKYFTLFASNVYASVYRVSVGHVWTISYEEQIYSLLPFVVIYLIRNEARFIPAFVIILLSSIKYLFIYYKLDHNAIYTLPITHFESIILGTLMGLGYFDKLLNNIKINILLVFSVLFFCTVGTLFIITPMLHYTYLAAAIFSVIFVYSANKNFYLSMILGSKIMRYLGRISYGLYLYHVDVCKFCDKALLKLGMEQNGILFLSSICLTILVSSISYRYLEKPILGIKDKYFTTIKI